MTAAAPAQDNGYFVDRLFRSDRASSPDEYLSGRAEAAAILAHSLLGNEASTADTVYLAQLVAAKTGTSPGDAQRRVSEVW